MRRSLRDPGSMAPVGYPPTDRLASGYDRAWKVAPVNAREFLDVLAGLPGARPVSAKGEDIAESKLIAGIEIARTSVSTERGLRRIWRQRSGKGADPLLLVVDDPEREGRVRVLGPRSESEPVRLVRADDLLRVVQRLPQPRLQAVRTLAEELEHLDQSGVPGLVVHGLGTEHLFNERLPRSPRWSRLSEATEGVAGEWREVLTKLGYELEQLLNRGYVARAAGKPAAVIWPLNDPSAFSKLDADGRPPEGLVINQCEQSGAHYGMLVSGSRFRLFEARPAAGSAVARYLELDAATLPPERRPLLGLLAPEYLTDGTFEALMREAREFGVQIRKRLDESIRQRVLPVLGAELGRWAKREGRELGDDCEREQLEAAALTFVFRSLFLLYAESAGHLPVNQETYRRHSFKQIVRDAADQAASLDETATSLYRSIQTLVEAMRKGNTAWSVPGYNGDLFAADGFEGAGLLEQAAIPDRALGPALVALGIDPETGDGYDFSGLEIGHLGHIYEGLLSLRLSLADRDYRYDPRSDRYVAASPEEAEISAGELLWLTDEGGRKGGGVYYTPEPLVRHLVKRGVVPAFERHLAEVEKLARDDPAQAARKLLDFRVLDPACGSAHFLVAVVDELADQVARFLARTPLPAVRRQLDDLRAGAGETYGVGVEDVALIRRLVLKHCVYGVDVSPMGAEIAKISLWLASFVPGLSLAYLDHNVRVGNSLIGVTSIEQLYDASGASSFPALLVAQAVEEAAKAALAMAEVMDRDPGEVERSVELDREAKAKTADARALLDLWVADALGLEGAGNKLWSAAESIGQGAYPAIIDPAQRLAEEHRAFHWVLEFAEAFAARGGFDAVIGNPPWEEVTVEELAFYARYRPGLRALSEKARMAALAELTRDRPELGERLDAERERVAVLKRYFAEDSSYAGSHADPDLYNFFCQRYRRLLTSGGSLAVVLPRSAFAARGSTGFRRWLFDDSSIQRLDFLLNRRCWMFETHPQYTVALAIGEATKPTAQHQIEVAGVADSLQAFTEQSATNGITLAAEALGLSLEVPLVSTQAEAALLAKLRDGHDRFPYGGHRWKCFPTREFDETDDKKLWEGQAEGRPLWKGESFDQYDPHGAEERRCPYTEEAVRRATRSKAGGESVLASEIPLAARVAAHRREMASARVGFRDVSRATDSRTVRAALIPVGTLLVNSVRYLIFMENRDLDRACCLGFLNSLTFDWQARRYVETHLSYFILEGLRLPKLSDNAYDRIAHAAARLSCPDERFAAFAEATGVECGPLHPEERDELRAEIDALVAHAYGLDPDELELVFSDFTLDAVPEDYRALVRRRFAELR
jgi:hypothetical protein